MEKLVVHFRPRDGIDLEKFWADWGDKYASLYSGRPGLARYIISRYRQSHGPKENDGPTRLWGMEEYWFRDAASYEQAQQALREDAGARAVIDEFEAQLAWKWAAWMEERVIVDSGYTELVRDGKSLLKLLVTFGLREGCDDDDTWKLWVVGHSQHHLHCGVRKYVNNRVKRVLVGDAGRIWGMPEVWYEDMAACELDHKEGLDTCRDYPEHKRIFEDFHKRTRENWGAFMEEKIIINEGEV